MNKKFEEKVSQSKIKYTNKKNARKEDVPTSSRYFDLFMKEKQEPLIKHPCIHWIGAHR